jgi:polyisoprenyl-phosphate glycosyltransferase
MKKLVSYVFPVYNEADNIEVLYAAIAGIANSLKSKYCFELIYVNDGSSDASLDKLLALAKLDCRVVIIDFARNYGHQLAITAGLDISKGDAVIIMDSDMQDPPAVSAQLIEKWEQGYDIIYAQRNSRKVSLFKQITANIYYRLLRKLTDIDLPRNTGDFRLINRKAVDELKKYKEHNRFMRGLVSYLGFNQTAVQFDREKRYAGKTHYPLSKMFGLAADGVFSFSMAPLKLISNFGFFIAATSMLGIVYAVVVKVLDPSSVVPGWTFTVISILFMGGIQLVMLGILGSYVGRIYTEVQNRPLYCAKRIYKAKDGLDVDLSDPLS